MKQKPNLTFWQLWNLTFGYIGIQLGYSLQSQMSGIFSNLSAVDNLTSFDKYLPILWIGGPLAGIIVQPVIGLMGDRTWTKLGRRIPFLLAGGILALLMMVLIVNAKYLAGALMPAVLLAAIMFLFMDCAFNLSMQPLRALMGDMVNDEQRNKGFGVQMVLLNIGAIVGFALPLILTSIIDSLGWENTKIGGINISMSWSFYIGGAILLLSVLWTTIRVKEYPPKEFAEYNGLTEEETKKKESFWKILKSTPKVMFQLAIVQFFVWMALFCMWTYGINGVAQNVFGLERINGTIDTSSVEFTNAQNWWGIANAVLSICALAFSFIWPALANKFGRKKIYSLALILGAFGLASIFLIHDKYILFLSMVGMGIATSVLNGIPFAIISAHVPPQKMGVYMGIFNLSIVIPQIVFALTGGFIFSLLVGDAGNNVIMLVVSGVLFAIAAICVAFVDDEDKVVAG